MKRYEKYKPTGIQWLPEIPEYWEAVKIKYCFNQRSEKGFPNEPILCATQSRGVIPQTLYENRVVVVNKGFEGLKLVKVGDFVISLRSFQGGIEYAYYQGIISSAYTILSPQKESSSPYFKYLFKSHPFIQLLQTCVTGIREGQNINYSVLGNSFIPIPPIPEQNKIVAYLDKRITLIENCKCQRERELQTLNELKQAEIASVVTRGLNPDVPMKDSGIPWIGQIPVHWDMKYLFQVAHEHYISNKDIHHQNLLSLSYGKIVHKDINTTEGLLPASFDTYQIIEPGNIVFRFTDLQNDHKSLRVGLSKETGIITSAYIAVEVDTIYILPEYFYYTLHSFDIKKLFYSMGGGLRQSLNYNGIRKLYLPIPPLEEQKAIVSFVDNKIKKIEVMIQSLESEIDRLTEYKQRLISDVVTGQIDVRGEQIQ